MTKLTYRHSGSLGDVIYSIPAILSQGKPANLFLQHSVPANWGMNLRHPSAPFRMSRTAAEWLLPLLNSQPGISASLWQYDRDVDVDLDSFRQSGINYLWGTIPQWYFFSLAGWYDLSSPWLVSPTTHQFANCVVVNRTSRYKTRINYGVLSTLKCRIVFVGMEDEYQEFVRQVPLAEYRATQTALDMAQIIKSARMFVGNQSFAYSVAEALKVPRVLEVSPGSPNVVPMGGSCYSTINQPGFDWAVTDCLKNLVPHQESDSGHVAMGSSGKRSL
jgi:hypothetical protein